MISVNAKHPLNALFPIEVTEEGIVISLNDEHPLNMLSIIFPIFPEIVNDLIPLKTFFPIELSFVLMMYIHQMHYFQLNLQKKELSFVLMMNILKK